jgi:hypothetical protein
MTSKTKERINGTPLSQQERDQLDSGILKYLQKHSKKKEVSTPAQPSQQNSHIPYDNK